MPVPETRHNKTLPICSPAPKRQMPGYSCWWVFLCYGGIITFDNFERKFFTEKTTFTALNY